MGAREAAASAHLELVAVLVIFDGVVTTGERVERPDMFRVPRGGAYERNDQRHAGMQMQQDPTTRGVLSVRRDSCAGGVPHQNHKLA